MAPIPFLSQPTTHSLSRRWTSCTYYDTDCSTHRTAIIIIIIAVVILKILILTLLFVRYSKRKAARARNQEIINQQTIRQINMNAEAGNAYTVVDKRFSSQQQVAGAGRKNNDNADAGVEVYEAPPVYTEMPKRPEAVRSPEITRVR